MRKINIAESHLGDAITSFPALHDLAQREDIAIWFANKGAADLWRHERAKLSPRLLAGGENHNTQLAYRVFCDSGLHIMQSWYWILRLPMPQRLHTVTLAEAPPNFSCDVVISAFSHSDLTLSEAGEFGGKTWDFARWKAVIEILLSAGLAVGVCGLFAAGPDPKFWDRLPVIMLDGLALPTLCGVLRGARCVATVDNGIGHLAHLMGVPHVHLLPDKPWIFPAEWVRNTNPNAEIVHEDFGLLNEKRVAAAILGVVSRFNERAYHFFNRDVTGGQLTAWQHYVLYGRAEGRSITPAARNGGRDLAAGSALTIPADIMPDYERTKRAEDLWAALAPKAAVGVPRVRKGKDFDGGYILLDRFDNVAIVYSLGISGDVSFDLAMAALDLAVFHYDHTIDAPPQTDARFTFHKTGLSGTTSADGTFKTLDDIVTMNGHRGRRDMILKMAIEGAEWTVFAAASPATLAGFSQIVVEFHGFLRLDDSGFYDTMRHVLGKLNETHQVVHIHADNSAPLGRPGNVILPDVLEISYARRSDFAFTDERTAFPTTLDQPNDPARPEHDFGSF